MSFRSLAGLCLALVLLGGLLGALVARPPGASGPVLHRYEKVRLQLLISRPDPSAPDAHPLYERLMEAARLASRGDARAARAVLVAIEDQLAKEPAGDEPEQEHAPPDQGSPEEPRGPRATPR